MIFSVQAPVWPATLNVCQELVEGEENVSLDVHHDVTDNSRAETSSV